VKIALTFIQLTIFVLMLGYRLLGPAPGINLGAAGEYIFAAYFLVIVFSLPSIIAKVFFRVEYFGTTSALLFLIYPLIYLFNWIVSKSVPIFDYSQVANYIGIFIICYWHYMLVLLVLTTAKNSLARYLKLVGLLLIPLALYLVFVFLPLRQLDSVVALDYLQHKAVVNQMAVNEHLCLEPVACSNLFLQRGYTAFFHTIYAVMVQGSGVEYAKMAYILDIIFPLAMAAAMFKVALKATGKSFWSIIIVTIGILVFENQAYTSQLFLPQTFVFLLYLQMLSSHKLTIAKVFLGGALLVTTHFVIGPFLAIQLGLFWLIAKYSSREGIIEKITVKFISSWIWVPSILIIFVIFLNLSGFSIERNFQVDATDLLGNQTNPYFPDNLWQYVGLLGFASVLMLPALFYHFKAKKMSKELLWALSAAYIATLIYFLAPTYAGKFLIGMGFYMGIIIVSYLMKFKQPLAKISASLMLIIAIGLFGYVNYGIYLSFYDQGNGQVSALVGRDTELVGVLNGIDTKCLVISDPYTQLVVVQGTSFETANAQYMGLESRKNLFELIQNPNDENYAALFDSQDLPKSEKYCLLYSYRMKGSVEANAYWVKYIYNSKLASDEVVNATDPLVQYLKSKGYDISFSSSDYVLMSTK